MYTYINTNIYVAKHNVKNGIYLLFSLISLSIQQLLKACWPVEYHCGRFWEYKNKAFIDVKEIEGKRHSSVHLH